MWERLMLIKNITKTTNAATATIPIFFIIEHLLFFKDKLEAYHGTVELSIKAN